MNKTTDTAVADLSDLSLTTSSAHDTLHHLAFENSLQANIISIASTGNIISANDAACRLLGYSKEELLSTSYAEIFDESKRSFQKMLAQRNEEGQSAASVSAILKNGKIISCEITSAVFMEEQIQKCITTMVDMSESILKQKQRDTMNDKIVAANVVLAKSKQKQIDKKKEKIVAENIVIAQTKSDLRLADNNEWIKYIGKTSYDVMWDWDITSGEIYVGDSIEELFGYKAENNTVHFTDFLSCLLPKERSIFKNKLSQTLASDSKSWSDTYMFKRQDGSIASTTSRASIIRDDERRAVRLIGALHDISRLQELECKVSEQVNGEDEDRGKFLMTAKLSSDIIWDWKLETNEIFRGEGFEAFSGYSAKDSQETISDWGKWLHPEDKESVRKGLNEAIESSAMQWQQTYRFMRADGSVAKLSDRASIFRLPNGKAYRLIGVMQDLSGQKVQYKSADELAASRKDILIDKIKSIVVELIHHTDEQLQTNFSDFLSAKLEYDYTYLANIFSESEGVPIQQFILLQKIDRVKDLIISGELNLTQIATKLHYSSVAHLSNQFKKITGQSPSQFKESQRQPAGVKV